MSAKILTSRLFKDSDELQKAAAAKHVKDHVEEGAVGSHVALIHRFLVNSTAAKSFMQKVTDPAETKQITIDFIQEIKDHEYGSITERMVHDYKTDRDIINFQYQNKADGIVGKMTIIQMDKEANFISTLNRPFVP